MSLRTFLYSTPFHAWRLARHAPDDLVSVPADCWPGDADAGRLMLDGRLARFAEAVDLPAADWKTDALNPDMVEHLHGFAWLRDLRELGGDAARVLARDLVAGWIARHGRWDRTLWRADLIGERLANWLAHHDFLAGSADDEFQDALTLSVVLQTRHLSRDLGSAPAGRRRFRAVKGLVLGSAALDDDAMAATAFSGLEMAMAAEVAADGGHRSRAPASHLSVMRDLIEARNALRMTERGAPEALQPTILAMTAALRLWRHGDGGLALFNGATEGNRAEIEAVLAQAEANRKTPPDLPDTGYQRLVAGRSCVIADSGRPEALDGEAHAAPLAFEFSHGKQRIVVNCGSAPGDPRWHDALRASAAHSTLVIDDRNAAEVGADGAVGPRPADVSVDRKDAEGRSLVELSHDGYGETHGLVHHRRLFLEADGTDLRGEDRLVYTGAPGEQARDAAVRFHLHPRVRASLVQGGGTAILAPPSGPGWRLRADVPMALNDSVYFGPDGTLQRTSQIVLTLPLVAVRESGETTVRWSIRREDPK